METYILWDRIVFSAPGKAHSDAPTRLMIALAHEVYGNMTGLVRLPDDEFDRSGTDARRCDLEKVAFQQGIDFASRLINHIDSQPEELRKEGEKTRKDLLAAIAREKAGIESWNRKCLSK